MPLSMTPGKVSLPPALLKIVNLLGGQNQVPIPLSVPLSMPEGAAAGIIGAPEEKGVLGALKSSIGIDKPGFLGNVYGGYQSLLKLIQKLGDSQDERN